MHKAFSKARFSTATDWLELRTQLPVAVMVLLPVIILFGDTYPVDSKRIYRYLGSFVLGGGLWVVGQFVQVLGQRMQEILRSRWGGRPAVFLMRHQYPAVIDSIKSVWHRKYAARLNVSFPTLAEERRRPKHADAIYAQAASWSERHTEDQAQFRSLGRLRAQYELMLSGFALRRIGLPVSILSALCECLRSGAVTFGSHGEWQVSASMSLQSESALRLIVSLAMAGLWQFWFMESRVQQTAWAYDLQLLEIGSELQIPVRPADLPVVGSES